MKFFIHDGKGNAVETTWEEMRRHDPTKHHRSCKPIAALVPVYSDWGKVLTIQLCKVGTIREETDTMITIPFDPDHVYEEEELKCYDHQTNMKECPKEQERLKFQKKELEALQKTNPAATTVPRPGLADIQNVTKIGSSCKPNAFVKLLWNEKEGRCNGYQILLSKKLKEGEIAVIRFPGIWKEFTFQLPCQKHWKDRKACPMEKKRIKHLAMLEREEEEKL